MIGNKLWKEHLTRLEHMCDDMAIRYLRHMCAVFSVSVSQEDWAEAVDDFEATGSLPERGAGQ